MSELYSYIASSCSGQYSWNVCVVCPLSPRLALAAGAGPPDASMSHDAHTGAATPLTHRRAPLARWHTLSQGYKDPLPEPARAPD